jgi:hypothetical protein
MYMIFILIQIKLDFEKNNDELLEIIWEHEKRKKKEKLIVTSGQQQRAQVWYCVHWCIIPKCGQLGSLVGVKSMSWVGHFRQKQIVV